MSKVPKQLTPFKPGQSGNPGGYSKKKREQNAFRKMSYEEFIGKLQKYGSAPKRELKAILTNPNTTAFDLMFIQIFYDAIDGKGDARNIILDRLWGKVKNQVELSSYDTEEDKEREELRKLSFDELAGLLRRMIPIETTEIVPIPGVIPAK